MAYLRRKGGGEVVGKKIEERTEKGTEKREEEWKMEGRIGEEDGR